MRDIFDIFPSSYDFCQEEERSDPMDCRNGEKRRHENAIKIQQ